MGQKDATCRKPFPPMTYGYAKCVCAAGRHRVKGRCRTCPHKKRKVTAKKQPPKTTTKKSRFSTCGTRGIVGASRFAPAFRFRFPDNISEFLMTVNGFFCINKVGVGGCHRLTHRVGRTSQVGSGRVGSGRGVGSVGVRLAVSCRILRSCHDHVHVHGIAT